MRRVKVASGRRLAAALACALACCVSGPIARAQSLAPTGYWQYQQSQPLASNGTNTTGVMALPGAVPSFTTAGMVGSGVEMDYASLPGSQSAVKYLDLNVSFGAAAAPVGGYALGNSFSIATWSYVSNISTGARSYIWEGESDFDLSLGNGASGSTTATAYGSTSQTVSVPNAMTAGTWRHLTQVFNSVSGNTTMTVYRDGVAIGTTASVLSTTITDTGIRIGTARGANVRPLYGTVDETAVWASKALSATEVLDAYNRGLAGVFLTNTNAVRGYVTGTSANAWLTGANWGGTSPGVTGNPASTNGDVAVVGNFAFTGGLGIDMDAAAGDLALGAISFNSLAGSGNLSIGNSATTDGTLTLNGAQIDGFSNVILSNEGLNNLTIANVQGTDVGQRMTLQLGGSTNSIRAAAGRTLTVATDIAERTTGSAVSIDGGGTVVLSGSNTFSGQTTVTSGTLTLANVSALQDSTLALSPASGTVAFGVPGTNTYSLGNLSGSGSLDAGPNTLAVGSNGASTTYSGDLTAAALEKQGAGTLMLSGSNTIDATTISAGTILAASNSALGSGTVTLSAGSLQLSRGVTLTNEIVLSGAATDVTFGGGLTAIEYLLVGGGGGGAARDSSGGGGGGGVETGITSAPSGGSYSVTVGAGGLGAVGSDSGGTGVGQSGESSSFGALSVLGGGGGGGYSVSGGTGATGGGGGRTSAGGTGTPGEGFNGGSGSLGGNLTINGGGGGGGGAGGSGGNAVWGVSAGSGGIGLVSDITGGSTYYGGGGGGTGHRDPSSTVASGSGGLGGGGAGSVSFGFAGNGTDGLGGGGGAARSNLTDSTSSGGNGGSGTVILRYLGGVGATGGTVSSGTGSAAGYTIHTFDGAGTSSFVVDSVDQAEVEIAGAITGTGGFTWNSAATLRLSGTSTFSGGAVVAAGRLLVDGSLASGVSIESGAQLGGTGVIAGTLSGAGLVGPGNSPGITTAPDIDPTGGLDFAFEFSATGSPDYADAANSINDVLRLTAATPFTSSLGADNVVDVYFLGSLAVNDTFRGGFYTDAGGDFSATLSAATFNYWVVGDGGGTDRVYNDTSFYSLANFDPTFVVNRSTVAESATFAGGGPVNGSVTEFMVVPEPGTFVLAGLGLAGVIALIRSRRVSA